jgi:hypothetical protein
MPYLLLHSPLLAASATWADLPAHLPGPVAPIPEVTGDEEPPYAERYVAAAVAQVLADPDDGPLTVVPHSGAGPLTAALVGALTRAGRRVGAVVFLDAGLPPEATGPEATAREATRSEATRSEATRSEATRLALLAAEAPAAAAGLTALFAAGGRFPNWTRDQLEVPDPDAILAGIRPRDAGFFTEPLPAAALPADLPGGYVQLSPTYAACADQAAARGWPVARADLGHFAMRTDPATVAGLIARVSPGRC